MSGHRSALVRIVAFSMDIRSLGRFSLFQWAIVAPSVNSCRTSKPSVTGMGGWIKEKALKKKKSVKIIKLHHA